MRRRISRNVGSVKENLARRGLMQFENGSAHGRFSATRFAYYAERFAGFYLKRHVVNSFKSGKRLAHHRLFKNEIFL